MMDRNNEQRVLQQEDLMQKAGGGSSNGTKAMATPPLDIKFTLHESSAEEGKSPRSPISPILKSPSTSQFSSPGGGVFREVSVSSDNRRANFRSSKPSVRFSTSDNSSQLQSPVSRFSASFLRRLDSEDDEDRDSVNSVTPVAFLRQDSIMIKVKPGEPFTRNSDILVEPPSKCDPKLGTLGELKHVMRTGTKIKVKKFLRTNHWPQGHRIRAELWKEMCQDREQTARITVYNETVLKLRQPFAPSMLGLKDMVFDDHDLNEHGHQTLLRLLTVLENLKPDYTYIPILYPLAALMLHYMEEAEAYACLGQLIERRGIYLLQTDVAISASYTTVMLLAKKYKSSVYNEMRKLLPSSNSEVALAAVFSEWKGWIFKQLPSNYVIRVTDCFLYEGQKVLFRVALSLLHYWCRWHRARPLHAPLGQWTVPMLQNEINTYISNIDVTVDKLLKNAFGVRNLKMSSISKVQEQNEMERRKVHGELSRRPSQFNMHKQSMSIYNAFLDLVLNQCPFMKPPLAIELSQWLPVRVNLLTPELLFSTQEHGTSFTRLWQQLDEIQQTLFIIHTHDQQILGAYCSAAWTERLSKERSKSLYFGTGESFLFSMKDEDEGPVRFAWVGLQGAKTTRSQEMYLAAGNDWLAVGGGGGDGLKITGSLVSGYSERCDTFNNEPLATNRDFDIAHLQVFGFMED